MVLGTFFKTAFEKGLPAHEQLVKQLIPLLNNTKTSYWPCHYANGQTSRQAGTALSTRLRLPGKNRRTCISTSATPALDISKFRGAETKSFEDTDTQVFISTAKPTGAAPRHAESVDQKWAEAFEAVNSSASAFNNASDIHNESLSKEIMHRLATPGTLKEGALFAHDGALGSNSVDDVKFSVVTHDPAAALLLKHMANPTPQVDPVSFPNHFTVYHVHDYEFADSKIIEEFGGISKEQLGVTSKNFILYDLAERNVFVSGSTRALTDAIVCMGSLVNFHVYGSLTMACNSYISKDGQLTVVFGGKEGLAGADLYGAHHNIWTPNGISRAWNGSTTALSAGAAPNTEFCCDLVETTDKATYHTAPLPLQLGGVTRPRGSNNDMGLAIDDTLAWRPNVVSAEGAKFIFTGKGSRTMSVSEAAAAYADMHAGYPAGCATKKDLAASFEALAATAPGATFSGA